MQQGPPPPFMPTYQPQQQQQQQYQQQGYAQPGVAAPYPVPFPQQASGPPSSGPGSLGGGPPSTGSYQQQQQQYYFMPGQAPHSGSHVPPPGPGGYAMPPGGFGAAHPGGPAVDPFMSTLATNVLRPYGENYLQRGHAFVQSKMSFLSYGSLHYHFNIDGAYVRSKLLMLLAPYLRRWHFSRSLEQISGGHKYLPPRQDVNAPDLYIPAVSFWTYVVLTGLAAVSRGAFTPDIMYAAVSSAVAAWSMHFLLLKGATYALGLPGGAVPILEAAAYTGYAFVPICLCVLARLLLGTWAFYGTYVYLSLAMSMMLIRTMKRVIFQEAQQYNIEPSRHNYLLLLLAVFQFLYIFWMSLRL